MSSTQDPSPIPAPVRAVLELFSGPLAEVSFPDVDRESLAASAAEVESRREVLQSALEAVARAREALEAGQASLIEQAQKAHAYASVFASSDADLQSALAEIKFDGRALAPKRRRGRPRKAKAASNAGSAKAQSQTSLAVADSDAA
ncbi:hypothetical protein G6O69_36700 [Pseudenhygromyxa sp. WMMC2535]|uniref:hypothetical protein n=1 Tax=Pseudenhygromyxa sp. WMMC2535 TaxID=2712867 RepID=UPI00155450A4|nr:hypothetical protein [Pseudenhygromyxa sp. WMMC2535]NVB36235.1 hypothetical protein [Pseudenhygromyxa sp. WMMC2535]NVB43423.1 hypothetical protein [Pseudenhygromyxa sp. WMMC2535]